jgi:hypothetical protein
MKRYQYVLGLLLIIASINVSEAQWKYETVPPEVESAFKKTYPEVGSKQVDWDWKNSCHKAINCYEANFKKDGKRNKIYFDSKGHWISTRQKDLSVSEIPNIVKDSLSTTEFSNWQIKDIRKVMTPTKVSYEMTVKKGRKKEELSFDENGNRVGKEKI